MKHVFETLVTLYTKSGRKDKSSLIEKNKDNDKLLKLLSLSMDDYYVYGVSEATFEKIIQKSEFFYNQEQLKSIFDLTSSYNDGKYDYFVNTLIPFLLEKQSPSTEVINELSKFFKDLNQIERYFYYRVIIKNLNIGLGPKTINDAIGKLLIKQYTPMLADSGIEKFEKWTFTDDKPKYLCDTKINGLRLTLFINIKSNDIEIKTRSGQRFFYFEDYLKKYWLSKEEIKKNILDIMKYQNDKIDESKSSANKFSDVLAIDCELQHKDKTWESSISVINLKEIEIYGSPLEEEPLFYLHCFDIVDEKPFLPENFEKQLPTLPQTERRIALEKFINSLHKCEASTIFKLTECPLIEDDLSLVEQQAKKNVQNGFEGAVVKHPDVQYVCKRGSHWLKIKDIQTYDGTIVDILPGDKSGKYNNVAGKIIVKVNIAGKELSGSVGSGFKESDRIKLMSERDKLIGKTVEFSILGKTVKDNFQSGVFKCLRMDK